MYYEEKVFSFLLGATFLVIGGFGVFYANEVRAAEGYNKHLNYIDQWCDISGDNCATTIVLPVPND